MSEIKARFVGHPDGTYLPLIPVGDEGETRALHIPYNGELPTEIDGLSVDTAYRNSLLDQKDNWTQVRRQTAKAKAPESKPEAATENKEA